MIFISYSSKDSNKVIPINDTLHAHGFETWFAEQDIKAGENYAQSITKAIQECSCLILVYSSNVVDSKHVIRELELALKYGKKIYPLRIDRTEPTEAFEYYLSTVQYIDIFVDYQERLNGFLALLSKEYGKPIKHYTSKDFSVDSDHKSFNTACKINTKNSYESYLKGYPNGIHKDAATLCINSLLVKDTVEEESIESVLESNIVGLYIFTGLMIFGISLYFFSDDLRVVLLFTFINYAMFMMINWLINGFLEKKGISMIIAFIFIVPFTYYLGTDTYDRSYTKEAAPVAIEEQDENITR
jgi:hypothetical protein